MESLGLGLGPGPRPGPGLALLGLAWATSFEISLAAGTNCDFERVDGSRLTKEQVDQLRRPLVLTGLIDQWPAQSKWSSASAFSQLYGDGPGYARDHDQLELRDVDVTVEAYLAGPAGAGDESKAGLSTSSAFFVNDYEDSRLLDRLRGDYTVPPPLDGLEALRVFSLERPLAGVAFHRHEASWQALVTGRKAWFLSHPSIEAVPQTSPCGFLGDGMPPMAEHCELRAGEVLFVPTGWWHATCTLPTEPTIAIGGVGSTRTWPPAVLAARLGRDAELSTLPLQADTQVNAGSGSAGIFLGGEGPLFMAASFGHQGTVRALLAGAGAGAAAGARLTDPNAKRRDGRAPLHEAARRGDLAIVELLCDAGADVTAVDERGATPLHHACAERGSVEVVQSLLARGASAAGRRKDGQTAVHAACRGHVNPVATLRALVRQGHVSPSLRDRQGRTPLMHCAAAGHRFGVGLLLRLGGTDAASALDEDGLDALGHALQGRGDLGVVERLLAAGLSAKDRLPDAARLGESVLLPVLAAAGAEVVGSGAVLEAARAGHAEVVQVLVQSLGASATEADAEGTTALHAAALGGHLRVAQALMEAGASAEVEDALGMTALHYVAGAGSHVPLRRKRELMQALVKAGGQGLWQRGAEKANGLEPLHLAAASGDVGLVRWLVMEEKVADPRTQDLTGATPADAAEKANHTVLATLLREWAQRTEL